MGRDYKVKTSKTEKYEDGYESKKFKKLDSYDRNKTRKQNKFNLNTFSVEEDKFEDFISETEETT